ncbi:MAG: ABC transporter ATP-binding protein [Leptolyngbyaceae cyanobacterium bins.349]|nr:ABC transporter ATP-binding protein [Leptolyngbyaceae cyanobacterium bins.349]
MSDTVIRVENLSKKYVLTHQPTGRSYKALRDVIADGAKSMAKRFTFKSQHSALSTQSSSREEFWALKDVSFEIKQGDRVGIIGRNGAGKSTLLKILSRIVEPTSGRIGIRGRVASLLEVGTGFHPELTGRENIFLNGAILGMSKAEITRKFDEIVDFAEVEKFLDTPVKRYSSGMYVRLAFAVAAHLEPEVLIVDEVLAVGDSQFQRKCLGKMETVASEGRTVIFVSHQMAAINNLCSTCVVLKSGQLKFQGKTEQGIKHYLEACVQNSAEDEDLQSFRPSWAKPIIKSARILDSQDQERTRFPLDGNITIEMIFDTEQESGLKSPVMGVVINHATFGTVGGVNTRMTGFESSEKECRNAIMRCTLENLPLLQGDYTVDLWLGDGSNDIDTLTGYLNFHIEETDIYGTGKPPFGHMGVFLLKPKWEFIRFNENTQVSINLRID